MINKSTQRCYKSEIKKKFLKTTAFLLKDLMSLLIADNFRA